MADITPEMFGGPGFFSTSLIGEITYGDIIAAVIILLATYIIGRILSVVVMRILTGKVEISNSAFLSKLARWLVYFVGIVAASPFLHIDFSGLMVAGGIVAIAIGFASQNTLSNFVAGVLLMFERPVGIGDNISVNGIQGYVEDIGLLSTTIRSYDGIFVRIPNESMFSSAITNYVAHIARRFDYIISIRYSDDADKAIKVIKEVIDKHPYALKSPSPSVYVDDLSANGINIKVRIWSPSGFWWDVRTDMLWKLFQALRKAGIDIPFPQLTLWTGEDATKSAKVATKGSGFSPQDVLGKSEASPENAIKVIK